jgi:hypothetical protein
MTRWVSPEPDLVAGGRAEQVGVLPARDDRHQRFPFLLVAFDFLAPDFRAVDVRAAAFLVARAGGDVWLTRVLGAPSSKPRAASSARASILVCRASSPPLTRPLKPTTLRAPA